MKTHPNLTNWPWTLLNLLLQSGVFLQLACNHQATAGSAAGLWSRTERFHSGFWQRPSPSLAEPVFQPGWDSSQRSAEPPSTAPLFLLLSAGLPVSCLYPGPPAHTEFHFVFSGCSVQSLPQAWRSGWPGDKMGILYNFLKSKIHLIDLSILIEWILMTF